MPPARELKGEFPDGLHAMMERLASDPELLRQTEAALDGKTMEAFVLERAAQGACVFCAANGIIKVDDCEVCICFRCFRILYANIDSFKRFMGC